MYTILSNAVSAPNVKSILFSRNISIGFIYVIISILTCLHPVDIAVGGGIIHLDFTILIFSIFMILLSIIILNLTSFYPFISRNKEENKIKLNNLFNHFELTEYSIIVLLIIIGAIFLMSSLDIVSVFLAIELQSYGLYILCTLHRNSESSTSAGLTYFLLGSLASCLILLGQAFLYANEGNTSLENLHIITSLSDLSIYTNINYIFYSIQIALVILAVGFMFKISAAPFHFWSPDVYDGIPTVVTTFVAIMAKISILILLLELINFTYKDLFSYNWTNVLLFSAVVSMIIGTLLGLTQTRLKRLYAYSTISHIGFLLLALSIFTQESLQAFFFYLMQYSLSNLNVFLITVVIGYTFFIYKTKESLLMGPQINKMEKYNSPLQLISQLKGYFFANPMIGLSLAIALFSFAGVPPLVGFFAKQMVLKAALSQGYVFISFIAILTSVISAVYYLMIVRQMFFEKGDISENPNTNITISEYLMDIISILTLLILLFIVFINEAFNFFNIISFTFFNF